MISPEPLFLEGSAGALFALYVPASSRGDRGVVLLPPFAEEMNLSRRMLRLQASALAERGIAALVLDLFGTGDSAGDFGDASWDIWIDDTGVGAEFLRRRGCGRIGLLGTRLGAILGAAATVRLDAPCFATVLWQPVVLGRTYLNELLRIRALTRMSSTNPPSATGDMRSLFDKGETVEIAGYAVNPTLAAALNTLDLAQLGSAQLGPVTWLEVRRDANGISAAADRCVAAWRARGMIVEAKSVDGVPFWTGQGNRLVSDLLAMTVIAFASGP